MSIHLKSGAVDAASVYLRIGEICMNRKRTHFLLTLGFTLLIGVAFALPVMAMGKGGGGSGGSGGTGGSGGSGGGGGTLTVSCIEWALTGGKGQHIHVQAFVADENGTPVLDAVVSMSARRDGTEYNVVGGPTENYAGLDGGVDCLGGPPGSGITRDFCVNKAPVGYYDAIVLSVSKDGYTWDGSTPANGKDFLGKQ